MAPFTTALATLCTHTGGEKASLPTQGTMPCSLSKPGRVKSASSGLPTKPRGILVPVYVKFM